MSKESEKKEKLNSWKKQLLYMLFAMLVSGGLTTVIFIVARRFWGCEYSFLFGDQEAQFLLADRMFWRHLLNGEGLSVSFNYSMGLPTSALYAVLEMSPFGIIHAFIQNAELAAIIIYLLKIMCSAAAFCLFSVKVLKSDEKKAVLFGVIYALSAYSLHFYMNAHFLDVVYIAPVLFLALEKFIKTERRSLLIAVYAFSFINIFLTGYTLGIFSFVVFLALLYYKGVSGKELLRKTVSYVLSVLTAVLISLVVILPTAYFFVNHMSGGSTFSATGKMYPWEFLISFLPGRDAIVFNTVPALYCGIPVVILVLLFFIDSDNSKRERTAVAIPLAFLLICTFFRPAYLLMHCFDEPDSFAFRFSYLWVLYLLSVSVTELYRITVRGRIKNLYLTLGLTGGIYFVLFVLVQLFKIPSEQPGLLQWGLSLGFFAIYAVALIATVKGEKQRKVLWVRIFVLLWVAEVVISGALSLQNLRQDNDTLRSNVEERADSKAVLESIYDEICQNEEDVFFRVDLPASYSSNECMDLDMHGMGYFSSVESTALRNTLYSLGYQARPQYVTGRGGTEFTRMIFDNKYTIERNWSKSGREQFEITEYPQTLPLAFMVSGDLTEYKAEGNNPFINQNRLASAMAGEDVRIFYDQDLEGSLTGLSFDQDENYNYLIVEEESGGIGVCEFAATNENGEPVYLYMSQDEIRPDLYQGATIMPDEIGSDWAGVGYGLYVPGIVPMKKTEDGRNVATLVVQKNPGTYVYYKQSLCVGTDTEELNRFYNSLSAGALRMTSFNNKRIEGKITVSENMPVLYTSIPYDAGWKILVDGQEADTFAVMDGAFLASRMAPGEHEIVFIYRQPLRLVSIICLVAGLILFGIFVYFDLKRTKEHAYVEEESSTLPVPEEKTEENETKVEAEKSEETEKTAETEEIEKTKEKPTRVISQSEKEQRRDLIIKCLVAFVFPILLCIVFCAVNKQSFFNLYVPGSTKNDSLLYYKVVESVLSFGKPNGYFGYNEYHSIFGNLPAWSPFIYVPWIIWGRVFGWSYYSAIISNIMFYSVALSVFVLCVKPKWKNMIAFFAVSSLFTSIPLYLINIQPEMMITSAMIIYFGFAYKLTETEKKKPFIIGMLLIAFFLTMIRPYMILLFVLPVYRIIREKMFKHPVIVSVCVVGGSVLGYYLSMHYFTSPYFDTLFDTTLLKNILTFKFGEAWNMISTILSDFGYEMSIVMNATFVTGCSAGNQYLVVLLSMAVAAVYCFDKDNKKNREVNISFLIMTVSLCMAILLLLHTALEGSRHLFAFSVVGCVICCFNEWNKKSIAAVSAMLVLLVALVFRGSFTPIDYSAPVAEGNIKKNVEYWEKTFEKIDLSDSTGYECTVDWMFKDYVEGYIVEIEFGELYGMPKGMGLNCCNYDFMAENFYRTKSRFIATPCGGEVEYACLESGFTEVGRTDNIVIYARY